MSNYSFTVTSCPNDLINSAFTRTLAANIELVFLTGTSNIGGIGNT